jgi:hypothetical protein
MLLAAFTAGLAGTPGQQVRFRLSKSIEEALQIAVTVYKAEAQEKREQTFYSKSRVHCSNCNIFGHSFSECRHHFRPAARKPNTSVSRNQRPETCTQHSSRTGSSSRNAQTRNDISCWECGKLGHFRKDRYKLLRNNSFKPYPGYNNGNRQTCTPTRSNNNF